MIIAIKYTFYFVYTATDDLTSLSIVKAYIDSVQSVEDKNPVAASVERVIAVDYDVEQVQTLAEIMEGYKISADALIKTCAFNLVDAVPAVTLLNEETKSIDAAINVLGDSTIITTENEVILIEGIKAAVDKLNRNASISRATSYKLGHMIKSFHQFYERNVKKTKGVTWKNYVPQKLNIPYQMANHAERFYELLEVYPRLHLITDISYSTLFKQATALRNFLKGSDPSVVGYWKHSLTIAEQKACYLVP